MYLKNILMLFEGKNFKANSKLIYYYRIDNNIEIPTKYNNIFFSKNLDKLS